MGFVYQISSCKNEISLKPNYRSIVVGTTFVKDLPLHKTDKRFFDRPSGKLGNEVQSFMPVA